MVIIKLIYYSIKQSLNCKKIKRTIVSTDSLYIARLAKKMGAEVPFLRPKKYSGNSSRDIDFLYHCIKWLKENENYYPELVVQLRPTQPLRSVSQIKKAIKEPIIEALINIKADAAIRYTHPIKPSIPHQ